MARRRVELPPGLALRELTDADGRLVVRVTPGARGEGIEVVDRRVLLKVRAKPEDGRANAAVLAVLAQALGVAPSRLALLRGATSREKVFLLPPEA